MDRLSNHILRLLYVLNYLRPAPHISQITLDQPLPEPYMSSVTLDQPLSEPSSCFPSVLQPPIRVTPWATFEAFSFPPVYPSSSPELWGPSHAPSSLPHSPPCNPGLIISFCWSPFMEFCSLSPKSAPSHGQPVYISSADKILQCVLLPTHDFFFGDLLLYDLVPDDHLVKSKQCPSTLSFNTC